MYQRRQYGSTPNMASVGNDCYNTAKSSTSVVENDRSNFSNESIERLPPEILFLIIEKVDAHTIVNCLHKNIFWRTIYDLYHEDETFRLKSNSMLSYKDLFKNSLMWNFEVSFSLRNTCSVDCIRKINIYRDNIIVINHEGVKYFDHKTFEKKRELNIQQCFDLNESDAFVVLSKKHHSEEILVKLSLYGKTHRNVYDNEFLGYLIAINIPYGRTNAIKLRGVGHYMIEKNNCYVSNKNNVVTCYTWKDNQEWHSRTLGRFYWNRGDLATINVLNSEVFLLIKLGQLFCYCNEKRNFQEATRLRIPRAENVCLRMVHKYCVVIGVPHNCEFRITRYRNNEGYNFYKFECPNLTCVTEHGEMLFLGFSDGRIELYMPRAISREDIFKRRIHISDFKKGHIDPKDLIVVSIEVYEDFGEHHLFIATSSCVYHLVVTHPDGICVWENIPERVVYYKYPIRTRCAL